MFKCTVLIDVFTPVIPSTFCHQVIGCYMYLIKKKSTASIDLVENWMDFGLELLEKNNQKNKHLCR